MLFPSHACAARCKDFLLRYAPGIQCSQVRIFDFVPQPEKAAALPEDQILPHVSAVLFPREHWPTAKAFWQHTGEGIQSRRAEVCQRAFDEKLLVDQTTLSLPTPRQARGPRRYQRTLSSDLTGRNDCNGHLRDSVVGPTVPNGVHDSAQFVEERYGRNLNILFACQAKLALRKRIAGSLTVNIDLPESLDQPTDTVHQRTRDVPGFSTDDVYIYSCGMNAIYHAHHTLLLARGPGHGAEAELKSIMYGFPYVDTLKVLEKFGPGALFYGRGDAAELDDLEQRCAAGERYLALWCEFPGNPLLKSPDLRRIRRLADRYGFAVVVDETIGNFLNVHVLPYADVVVSSLTKIFSGASNVMGGALILNPQTPFYASLKATLRAEYEDNQFAEDAVYLERNSRDFVSRIARVNLNAAALAALLRAHAGPDKPIKEIFYPQYSATREFYDACRLPDGGYGGLLSATFHSVAAAARFYDALETAKGPSLGTNFTLVSPFVLLAHYGELEWAEQFGCEQSLIRFSVGLEETAGLLAAVEAALKAVGTDGQAATTAAATPAAPATVTAA